MAGRAPTTLFQALRPPRSSATNFTRSRFTPALSPVSSSICSRCLESRRLPSPLTRAYTSAPSSPSERLSSTSSSHIPPRPQTRTLRDLPKLPDRRPIWIATAVVVVTAWALFVQYATNKERLSSSVFRSVLIQLKDSNRVSDVLGTPVMLEPGTFGDPWVAGTVNMMQGKVDISFRIKGPRGAGTAYFTSIRRDQKRHFEVLRFLVVTDKGDMIGMLQDEDGTTNAAMTHDQDGDIAFV